MKSKIAIVIFGLLVIAGLGSLFLRKQEPVPLNGMLIFTQVPASDSDYKPWDGDTWRCFSKARLVAKDPVSDDGEIKVLTNDFFSACSPRVSFDGKQLLFAGQLKEKDPWQIWRMSLEDFQFRQVTHRLENCTDPAYISGDLILYSRQADDKSPTAGQALFTCKFDGTEETRITYHPHSDFASTVMHDGRILFISRQLFPSIGIPKLVSIRPDGTKAGLFYKSPEESWVISRASETNDRKIVFVESNEKETNGGKLVAVSFNRPLNSKEILSNDLEGSFHSVCPLPSGKFLVSYRPSVDENYGIYEFDPGTKSLGHLIQEDPNFDNFEPVPVAESSRPKNLPSIVNEQKDKGWFVCLNSNFIGEPSPENLPALEKAIKAQVFGTEGSFGEVLLEKDGSFYIEVPADQPLRIQTIDKNGDLVMGPSSWIWIRPNERRTCIGCHENRELAPENLAPLAMNKPPVPFLNGTQKADWESSSEDK